MSRILTLALLSTSLALPISADPVIDMMRSQSTEGPVYAYEMTYAEADMVVTGTIDPSQPEGQRIQVTSPAESEWTAEFRDQLEDMEAETKGDIWCADFAELVPATATALD